MIALSAISGGARAFEVPRPVLPQSWALFAAHSAVEGRTQAGATFRTHRDWSTKLFITYFGERSPAEADGLRLRPYSTVGAQVTGRLSKSLRVHFDVINLFDHQRESYFLQPAEPRGFRISVTKHF